jgi:hypothetical protein
MKLTYKQVKEARDLYYNGVVLDNLAALFDVSPYIMSKYIRAIDRYGKSFWSPYPTEVEDV